LKPEDSRTRGRRTWRRRLTQSTTQRNRARGDAELDKARPPARLRDEAKGGACGIHRKRPRLPWLSEDLSHMVARNSSPSEEKPRREAALSRKNSEPATLTPLREKQQQRKIEPPSGLRRRKAARVKPNRTAARFRKRKHEHGWWRRAIGKGRNTGATATLAPH
jgi:hypothetical protein